MMSSSGFSHHRILVGVVVLAIACVRFDPQPERRPAELVMHSTAYDLQHVRVENVENVSYQALIAYPAEPLIREVGQRLEELGWTPLADGRTGGGELGVARQQWTRVAVESEEGSPLWLWIGEWVNAKGEKVTYSFEDKEDGRDVTTVRMQIRHRERFGSPRVGGGRTGAIAARPESILWGTSAGKALRGGDCREARRILGAVPQEGRNPLWYVVYADAGMTCYTDNSSAELPDRDLAVVAEGEVKYPADPMIRVWHARFLEQTGDHAAASGKFAEARRLAEGVVAGQADAAQRQQSQAILEMLSSLGH